MSNLKNLTIALDVDGALSPITGMGTGLPENTFDGWSYRVLSPRNFGASVADEVIAALKSLRAAGASIEWHTSWDDRAQSGLGPEVELPDLELFADRSGLPTDGWWKAAAVANWLEATEGTDERLIWIDDDISEAVFAGEIPSSIIHHPRVSMVSPHSYWGLSPADLEAIVSAAHGDTRIALANDPDDPRPLPENPGSIIAWGEVEDAETDERWTATATAILTPEGAIVWGDSFIDGESSTELFTPEHLNSVEWIPLVETVVADHAPDFVKAAFADGETVTGAVFDAPLEDVPDPVAFTTAAGVFYRGELSEVYSVDVYGNTTDSTEREPRFLPTILL